MLVTLNRFDLYDRLRLPPVSDTNEERTRNADLMGFLQHEAMESASLTYRSVPPDQGPPAGTAGETT